MPKGWIQNQLKSQQHSPASLAFGQQRAAIECCEKQVALLCSGRAGKSRGALLKWREVAARKPGFLTPYIGLTRESVRRIIWPQTVAVNEDMGLGLKPNYSDLTFTDPQGSILSIIGSNREDEIHKLRGFPMVLALVDEAAFIRDSLLRQLIHDVIGPRLADADGELWVMCTPGLVPAGTFYRITIGAEPGWRVFSWGYLDNPHLPLDLPGQPHRSAEEKLQARRDYLRELRARNRWDHCERCDRHEDQHPPTDACPEYVHHPTYVREWLGQWVRDDSALVYAFRRERNLIARMPDDYEARRDEWVHVIGIDYGYTDDVAHVALAFRTYGTDQTVYVVESDSRPNLTPGQAAGWTKELAARYEAAILVGDPAARGYIEEANDRHQLGIEDADKQRKRAFIEHMNGALREARIKVVGEVGPDDVVRGPNAGLVEEWERLPWADYPQDDPRWHQQEDPRFANHRPDAALYGWRRCLAYANTDPEPEPYDPARHGWQDDEDPDHDPEDEPPWWDQ